MRFDSFTPTIPRIDLPGLNIPVYLCGLCSGNHSDCCGASVSGYFSRDSLVKGKRLYSSRVILVETRQRFFKILYKMLKVPVGGTGMTYRPPAAGDDNLLA